MALVLLAVTFALMWVLFIRPQQRRVKAHQVVVAGLGVGDEVMTSAGLFATIAALDDEHVHLEVAPGTVLRFARGAVARSVTAEAAAAAGTPAPSARRPSVTAADRAPELRSPTPTDAIAADVDENEERP